MPHLLYGNNLLISFAFPHSSVGKESTCNAGDLGSIAGLGRSPGKGKAYPLQYSGLENSMDCIVHGVTKNRTQLSDFHLALLGALISLLDSHNSNGWTGTSNFPLVGDEGNRAKGVKRCA